MNKATKKYNSRYVSRGGILTVLISPAGYADHNGGSDTGDNPIGNANCNASFKSCSYAAPWPSIGSGPVELGLLAVVLCALLFGKRLRRKLNTLSMN